MRNPINLKPMSNEEFNIFKLVASKYLYISPNGGSKGVISNTCIDLDKDAKQILDELVVLRNSQDKQVHINFLVYANRLVLNKFNIFNCRNRIENTRLDEAGNVSTKFSIKSEQSVIGKSNSQTNVYIVIGGLVILSTLVILLTNNK